MLSFKTISLYFARWIIAKRLFVFFFKSRSQDFQQFVSNIFICESMHFIYYCINVLWINKERECWGTCEIYINNCIIYTICLKFSNFEVHSTCVLLAKAIIWNVSISDSYSTSSFISFYNVCKLNLLVQLLFLIYLLHP